MGKRLTALCLALLMVFALVPAAALAAAGQEHTATVLFTHDMHAHFLPTEDGLGGESGGFARLATLLEQQRDSHPDAVTVDAGDFSMGSLFQSIYATDAPELRLMGQLGYDAVTFGNHEFDFRKSGFTAMLNAAAASGDTLPRIVEANYAPLTPADADYSAEDAAARQAMTACGVQDYTLIERGGITYGIFGIMGAESDSNAPESGMVFEDPVTSAQETVDAIRAAADPDLPLFIICLSHSGTSENAKKSEDEILAKKVSGIDLIVSGHTHTTLAQPIQVGDTLIVSAGCYMENLGSITVSWDDSGNKTVLSYDLIPVDESVSENARIAARVEAFKKLVSTNYLADFGFSSFDEVVGFNSVSFDSVEEVYAKHGESGLGDLIADSYRYAVETAEQGSGEPVTVALTATGVIRDTIHLGDVTVSDAFSVSSLGIGTDGLAGYPLVSAYLTGAELRALCEVDASVTPLMEAAQLHLSGLTFTWNANRLIFNKVDTCQILNKDGSTTEVERDKLYRVVTGLYCAQMLSAVKAQSFGLLSITPKYADGTPISDFDDCILYDESGNEIKEWYALASYIRSFESEGIPDSYDNSACTQRKIQQDSWSPVALLRHASRLTIAVVCFAGAVILALVWLIALVLRRLFAPRRYGAGVKAYTAQHKDFRPFHPGKNRKNYSTSRAVTGHSRPLRFKKRYGKGYQPAQRPAARRKTGKRRYGNYTHKRRGEASEPPEKQ